MSGTFSPPNLLTIGRVVAVPVICFLLVLGGPVAQWIALILFVAAAVTDWLDGYLARRMNLNSALGRMLDPIADKVLVVALFVILAWTRQLSALDLIPAIAILMREILIPGLREFLGPRNIVVHVSPLAKWKTTVQLVALAIIIAEPLIPGAGPVGSIALWIAGVLTVWTGAEYFAKAWPHLTGPAQ
jgi:cardiolipin synthase